MTHICTVATLCFPEKTFPRNYYYCVQDENSLCLCFKNMYRTLFVAIFTSTFIFSMYDHIGLPGCVFPYLSKYKYQQSYIDLKYHSKSWLVYHLGSTGCSSLLSSFFTETSMVALLGSNFTFFISILSAFNFI